MATLQAQTITNTINPTEGFVSYVKDVKPYHSKILEVLIEYVYKENIVTTVTEGENWVVSLTRPDVDLYTTCGFGTIWDSSVVPDYPTTTIIQAVGDVQVPVFPLVDIGQPTHLIVSNDPYHYILQVGDAVTFRTTGTLPTTTLGNISPGLVYYVLSNSANVVTISNTPTGSPLTFVTAGTGEVSLHPELLPYNSFLVDQPTPATFQCIVANVNSNQLVFTTAHNIVGVNTTAQQWVVQGQLLFAAYRDITFSYPVTTTSSTGLLNNATVYNMTIHIDKNSIPISAAGSTLQQIQDVIDLINTSITGQGVAVFNNGVIRVTSGSIGYQSSVRIVDGPGRKLLKAIFGYSGTTATVNDTSVIADNYLYVRNNTGNAANTQFTMVSGTYDTISGNTTITVKEPISSQAQPNGVVNIQDEIVLVPNWLYGTPVHVSSGTLPVPLSASATYYFVPSDVSSIFNLSTKQFPVEYKDIVNLQTLGSGIITISRNDIFYPGATITVSDTYLSENNGVYFVDNVKREGPHMRIYVQQKVARYTPPALTAPDGILVLDDQTGYDSPLFCALLRAPDLYTSAMVHDHISFEFSVVLTDAIKSNLSEDNGGVVGAIELVTRASTTTAYNVVPTGYDTQFLDIGPVDEDIYSLPHYSR